MLGHEEIGTDHLLLFALLDAPASTGTQILNDLCIPQYQRDA
ncbi:Clp protease N-terminal domain-containing protein [Rhodococcus sp. NPDC127593]